MDALSPKDRSRLMARIRYKDMKPAIAVRAMVRALGFGYLLNVHGLPGRPHLVFPGRRKVIFVHGCFCHRHPGCPKAFTPTTRQDYWLPKLARNVARDGEDQKALDVLGWSYMIVWECELQQSANLTVRLQAFLGPTRDNAASHTK